MELDMERDFDSATYSYWHRYDYLKDEVALLSVEANFFFTDEENALMLSTYNEDATDDEIKAAKQKLTAVIAEHKGPRELRYDRVYDRDLLSLDEQFKEYYTGEDGKLHYHVSVPNFISPNFVLFLKREHTSTEFLSEFHRVIGLTAGCFECVKIIIHWKSVDLCTQLLKEGCYINIKVGDEVVKKHFSLFTASAGQMRTEKFTLVDDDIMPVINESLFCGMTIDKINATKKMLSSKLLAYRALGCSASERLHNPDGSDFSVRQAVVVPDFNYKLQNIIIDNIAANGINRQHVAPDSEEMEYIGENANDGMGICLFGTLPHDVDTCIIRSCWMKGLVTSFDYLKFCEYNKVEPYITDVYGRKRYVGADSSKFDTYIDNNGIERTYPQVRMLLTESQFKLWNYWHSWEEYCNDWEKYDCHFCYLQSAATKDEDTFSPLNYQMFQNLMFMTEDEMKEILEQPIESIKNMATNRSTMLSVLGADKESENPRERALGYYNELIKLTEFRKDLQSAIHSKIDAARASKFKMGKDGCENRRLFVVREPWALCRYWFMGIADGAGFCDANHICCRAIKDKYDLKQVALTRSPSLFLDGVVVDVVHDEHQENEYENPYYWYRTNGIYISCKDGMYLLLNLDEDGDCLNLISSKPYVDALRRTIKEFDTVVNYYPGLSGTKTEITIDSLANAIITASKGNIGGISNTLTKVWNNKTFVDEVEKKKAGKKYNQQIIDDYIYTGKMLLLINQYNIDLAKTGYIPTLADELQEKIDRCVGKKQMPWFFQYTVNFTNNEAHRDMNTQERHDAVEQTTNSLCDSICKYVTSQVSEVGILDKNNRAVVMLGDYRGYDYKIFYGDDSNTKRKPEIIEIWKKMCQKFVYCRVKKETAKAASEMKISSDKIRTQMLWECLEKQGYTLKEIYYTLVDYLFRDNPFSDSCSSNKYFWLSPCGEKAAEIIEYNVKTGEYDKEGSYVDKFRKCCPACGHYFTPSGNTLGSRTGIIKNLCPICLAINAEETHAKSNHSARDKKAAEAESTRLSDFIQAAKEQNVTEEHFIEFVFEYNKTHNKITQKEVCSLAGRFNFNKIADLSIRTIKTRFKELKEREAAK